MKNSVSERVDRIFDEIAKEPDMEEIMLDIYHSYNRKKVLEEQRKRVGTNYFGDEKLKC